MEHICVCNKMVTQYPFLLHSIVKAFLILLVFLCLLKNGGLVKESLEILNQKRKKTSKNARAFPRWRYNMEHICACNKMVSRYPVLLHWIVRNLLVLLGFLWALENVENGGLVEHSQLNMDHFWLEAKKRKH